MKQILQNLKNGATELIDKPCPQTGRHQLFIKTSASLVSAGTERMLIDFGKGNYLQKARQQPDKVRMVIDKIKTDGLMPTVDSVFAKLDTPLPLGYCNVGRVAEIGSALTADFQVGDRVVSNGHHAEAVFISPNLCARIPETVTDEAATFTVVGAIALQGIRLAQPTLGEYFVVTGLGLIGLLAVQILVANGCQVLGIDFDSSKCALARTFGAQTVDLSKGEDPVAASVRFSHGRGVDGVLITASTKSSEPVLQAADMCRKRGRIVLVGVTGLELSRTIFYEKELSFQVSCSYGPGRYDPVYEDKAQDYPFAYVRWTEQRNFEAILDLMAAGKIDVTPLVTHRFPLSEAEKAYQMIADNTEPYIGIVLTYEPDQVDLSKTVTLGSEEPAAAGAPVIGMIGAGGYAGGVLLPAMKKAGGVRFRSIASSSGVSGTHLGRKFGFASSTTDMETIFADPDINTVVITTRHNSHAALVGKGLQAGKHVFVEKPLCLTLGELAQIETLAAEHPRQLLMVGFNRRFSPLVMALREALAVLPEPKAMVMTVNAGAIPMDHWTQDLKVGGGRMIGEACHFIDLLRHVAGRSIVSYDVMGMTSPAKDSFSVNLSFDDGSIGTVHYLANGTKSFPKERLEVFCGGRILHLDNFRSLRGHGFGKGFKNIRLWRQDKGQTEQMKAFFRAISQGGMAPISRKEIFEVSRVTLELAGRL
ncbi:bi-domain-containing oxidoreductase [Desulfomicrobium orale]|uniref:Dehydrogenase n=1 Tax=Desulfomicrobium orale DSM 12838 TaxID=888061 RepID=A0A109W5H8_9BACT|nr:bi-domain-containing oxidoreductase [Desulfomicrobium orale]AMD92045.1 dehydrogenase [Desulfomicrobium orale DSM 12838]